ncbi:MULTISPECIES: hypothetical protein [Flavobacterium]|uniref:Uncharacterized protein n=1 Tax=Flavobacterium lipolyticum TaxID=2893754 RepID=A0ABS8M6T6_9FLAO|nr:MULTISPECIES: hypothetical protein [Flavobacterium]MCC9020521.1 hypothetical protein [Flavobacterium sp. F-126]MDL2145499.1 hypothetical protein [Flavobacterium tructae]
MDVFLFLIKKKAPSIIPLRNNIEISLSIGTGSPTGGGMDCGCGTGGDGAAMLLCEIKRRITTNFNDLTFILLRIKSCEID